MKTKMRLGEAFLAIALVGLTLTVTGFGVSALHLRGCGASRPSPPLTTVAIEEATSVAKQSTEVEPTPAEKRQAQKEALEKRINE